MKLRCRESFDLGYERERRRRARRAALFTVFWLFFLAVAVAYAWICFTS